MSTQINRKISQYIGAFSLLLGGLMFGGSACQRHTEPVFETPARERLQQDVAEVKQKLVAAEYGWVMEYIPSAGKAFGGYRLGIQFREDNSVLISSEQQLTFAADGTPNSPVWAKSLYEVNTSNSTTISLLTANKAIEIFTSPEVQNGGGRGVGFAGDSEFIVLDHSSADTIRLRGVKTQNLMHLVRATKELDSHMNDVRDQKKAIFDGIEQEHFLSYRAVVGTDTLDFTFPSKEMNLMLVNGNSLKERDLRLPFYLRDNGLTIIENSDFLQKYPNLRNWEWDAENHTFTALNGQKIEGVLDPNFAAFKVFIGDYTLRIGAEGEEQDYDIKLSASGQRNVYLLTGLEFPRPLPVFFVPEENTFELKTVLLDQNPQTFLALWDSSLPLNMQNMTFFPMMRPGLKAQLVEGTTDTYEFVDNGVWKEHKGDSFVIWNIQAQSPSETFRPNKLIKPKFIRK